MKRSKCNAYGGTFKYLGKSAELFCVLPEGGHDTHVAAPFGRVQEWKGSYNRNVKSEPIKITLPDGRVAVLGDWVFKSPDEQEAISKLPQPSWLVRLWRWLTDWI